jgi:Fuc2NAc and GlcNAc transferase
MGFDLVNFYEFIPFLFLSFITTIVAVKIYKSFSINKGIFAKPNFRNLHQIPTPRGGGVVFSLIFLISVFITFSWNQLHIDKNLIFILLYGGLIASVFGFIDDVVEIKAKIKLFVQSLLSVFILFNFGWQPLLNLPWVPAFINLGISWFALVWLMNVFNFMDGSDGIVSFGTIFFCLSSILSVHIASGDLSLMMVFGFLAMSCAGFLLFNFPPASIFMGDSGSLFLGFFFSALVTFTVINEEISVCTWLIMLAYFLGDTTTTSILRIFLVKQWYGVHRSHAYQNLVRIGESHSKILFLISSYHILWLFPLVIFSVLQPNLAPLGVFLAFIPVVILTFRYGPRLSSS